MGDLVKNGVGYLVRRTVYRVIAAKKYLLLPLAAYAKFSRSAVEAERPVGKPIPIHEVAGPGGNFPKP